MYDYDEDRSYALQAEYAKEREESEKKLEKFLSELYSTLSASEELKEKFKTAVDKYTTATVDCAMAQRWTEGRIGGYQKVQYNTPERVKMQEAFEELKNLLSSELRRVALFEDSTQFKEARKTFEDYAGIRAYYESELEYG